MGTLTPAGKSNNENPRSKKSSRASSGKQPQQARKKREQSPEIGLSRNFTIILAFTVVVLGFTVAFFAFQINGLKVSNREKDLEITRLTKDVEILKSENPDEATTSATVNYAQVPENPGPGTVDGAENPEVAEVQKFNFEDLFNKSSTMIRQTQKISYYICNDKGALRLIEDSGMAYLLSKSEGIYYNVILFGSYEPDWIKELLRWEERKNQLLSTLSATSTENSTDTTMNTFKMPEELHGLEATKQEQVTAIQLMSSTNEEEISKKIWKLRNEDIPAYIYAYPVNYSNTYRYTLQIDMFPTRNEAVEYQNIMKAEFRDFYLQLISADVTRGYPRGIFGF
jgi:hypothetical protein